METLYKRFVFICVTALILLVIARVTGKIGHPSPHQVIERVVAQWNPMLPREAGDGLTVTSAEADGDILRLNANVSQHVDFRPQGQEIKLHDIAARQMCKPMKPLFKDNISAQYRFHYRDYGTDKVYDVTVLPSDCA